MRVAVIGTGIAGMGAAWLLRPGHELTVYEAAPRIGGHTNTVTVADPAGVFGIDTGFIVYNERNYPRLSTLFDLLGVATQPSDMSFSASLDEGRVEWAGDALFAQRRNLVSMAHWRMLGDVVRFNRRAKVARLDPIWETRSLGEFLAEGRYGPELVERYLLPMAAAIWSCPPEMMMAFPAAGLLRFFENHGLLDLANRPQWRTVSGGSHRYIERLTASYADAIRTATPAARIERDGDKVRVRDALGYWASYDRVFIATHADEALALLGDADEVERSLLAPFTYQPNRAVLHSDAALMPRRRSAWSSWNYLSRSDGGLSVTYWMNRLQRLEAADDYFVTLNPVVEPDPARVHYEAVYTHPVFDTAAMAAQRELGKLQGYRGCWYCGSYFGYGFHEDGFASAVAAALSAGVEVPPALKSAHSRQAVAIGR